MKLSTKTKTAKIRGYAAAVLLYIAARWLCVLPLPSGKKKEPPKGFTGPDGLVPDRAQINEWRQLFRNGNIALRLPDDVIGIDVDLYKPEGARNFAKLTEELGELPPTWRSSARKDGSGIFYFRVPAGSTFRGVAASGIDIIQHGHRYALVWPSRHPSGALYRWYAPDGKRTTKIPRPDELPELPESWLHDLSKQARRRTTHRSSSSARDKETADRVTYWFRRAIDAVEAGASRHDEMVSAVMGLVRARQLGDPHAAEALETLHDVFCTGVTSDGSRTDEEAEAEWQRSVSGAMEKLPDRYAPTDLGNAHRLVDDFGDKLRYVGATRNWLVYDGVRWKADETGAVERYAKAVAQALFQELVASDLSVEHHVALRKWALRSQDAARITGMVRLARTEPELAVTADVFDTDPYVINALNGVVDLRTATLRAHDAVDLYTKVVAVEYDPQAQAPRWERFLAEIFAGDVSLIEFWQRWSGYLLTGDVSEQLMAFAHGDGSNGKTVMMNVLRAVMGDYAITFDPTLLAASLYDRHPTGLMDFRGVRLAMSSETESDRFLAEATVKLLTGGDPIRARRVFRDSEEFRSTAKLLVCGNYLPNVRGTDEGIWRRIALVPFSVQFKGDRRDPKLEQKLLTEKAGIFTWMVQGAQLWVSQGLQIPEIVTARTDDYRSEQDQVGRFLQERMTFGSNLQVWAQELRDAFIDWCEDLGESPMSTKAVGAELTKRGFVRDRAGAGRRHRWCGFGLKT
jgi:putative DNA primase/helicase